jgi:DNA mismatch repair protein MutS2
MEDLARIEGISNESSKTSKGTPSNINITSFRPSSSLSSLNIVGLTVDDAVPVVEKFIDNALLYGIKELRIIHGVGTGRLKLSIHQFLQNDCRIKKFYLGSPFEGGVGVTIVELEP